MAEPVPQAELMRSLGRLVRGLSALFWALPFILVSSVQTTAASWWRYYEGILPILAYGLAFFGLWALGDFQKQERIWVKSLDWAKLCCLVNLGLSPFLFFWRRLPAVSYFSLMVSVLIFSSLVFLFLLNVMLKRLAAMLPDETLRSETTFFSKLNRYLVLSIVFLLAFYWAVFRWKPIHFLDAGFVAFRRNGSPLHPIDDLLIVFWVILPVAMTMALTWKIKEVILHSVFNQSP